MLPDMRKDEHLYTVPKFDLGKGDVRDFMSERIRFFSLILIMIAVCLIVVGITIRILYGTALKEECTRLMETAQSQARLIEAVARFDTDYSEDYPEGSIAATLSQIIDARKQYKGFGETGEFTLARREGDNIVFLLNHRHQSIDALDNPKPVPFDSELAEPMRLALSGKSGTMVGLDYRGETVLAAHEPVSELDLGIVAKIDLSEIRAPFVRAGLIAVGSAVLVVLGATALFLRISNPVIRRLEKHKVELEKANESLEKEAEERKRAEEAQRESKQELSIRNRISEIFLTISDDEMYGEVLQMVLEAMESPYGTFAYINEDGDRIVPSMTRDIWDECKMPDKGIFFPRDKWGDTLWAKCLIEKKSFSSNGPFTVPDGHIPVARAMATPIIYQGESIGNLMVGGKPTDYSGKDKKLLETIADHIAPILHSRLLNERHEEKRKLAEKQIKASLQEKEVLLREIHHRVKNNMQIISSLLKLQANTAKDGRVTDALMASQRRIQAMASVHETLYGSDSLASIDFKSYLSTLTKTIFQASETSRNRVKLNIEAENIKFGIEPAAPLGLLINELVSNSLKHAFPEKREGEITIKLKAIDQEEIEFMVSDNGIGIPKDLDWRHTDTLGFKLVTILAENQLNGTVNLNRDNGARFTIRFKLKEIGEKI
jgi:two-component sensor histidine kinase